MGQDVGETSGMFRKDLPLETVWVASLDPWLDRQKQRLVLIEPANKGVLTNRVEKMAADAEYLAGLAKGGWEKDGMEAYYDRCASELGEESKIGEEKFAKTMDEAGPGRGVREVIEAISKGEEVKPVEWHDFELLLGAELANEGKPGEGFGRAEQRLKDLIKEKGDDNVDLPTFLRI